MVRFQHVRTFFDSTQSEESKYEVCAQEFYAAMRIKTYLDNALYLSSLLSDLSMFKVNHQIINDRLYRCIDCTGVQSSFYFIGCIELKLTLPPHPERQD